MTPRSTYHYNPACPCEVCANNGHIPTNHPERGHSIGYAEPHIPPSTPRTRIIALLSWYDETPEWLDRCIRSLHHLPADHLIAIDGAYALYPNPQPRSPQPQYDAIRQAATQTGIGLTIHTPTEPWAGNEIAKRNHLFELAEQAAQPSDWYLVIDADEHVTHAPPNLKDTLANSIFDVANVTLHEPGHPMGTAMYTLPMLFRAIPGLRAHTNHFTYITPDGRKLWGNARTDRLEARLDLTTLTVEHHTHLRAYQRKDAALTYYQTRDHQGIEDITNDRHARIHKGGPNHHQPVSPRDPSQSIARAEDFFPA